MVQIRELLGKKENILIRELVRIRELVGIVRTMLIKELIQIRELVKKALLKSSCDFQVQLVIWGTKYSSDSRGGFMIMNTKCSWSAKHSRRLRIVLRLTITSCL